MGEQIAANDWICWDGYDISGVTSNAPITWSAEVKEFLCFKPPASGDSDPLSRKRLLGAENATMPVSGYLEWETNHTVASSSLGVNDAVLTRGFSRDLGSRCYLFVGVMGTFNFGGPVGEVIPFSADLSVSNSIVVPGRLFEFGSKAATGNGTSQEIGAATATQSLYLHAHAVAVTGTPSFALVYETSALGDYSDAVTRHTFTSFTAIGRQRAVVAGAITDTHGRFRWTLTGSGTILFRFAAGIR